MSLHGEERREHPMSEVVSDQTRILLTLSMLRGVGPAALRKVASIPGFEKKPTDFLATVSSHLARALASPDAWEKAEDGAEQQVVEAARYQARILSPCDDSYPPLLAATKDDPGLIYVKGTLAKIPARSVAVIGTREPTAHGHTIAVRISQFFAEQGWSVVSGLALGCDAIAHQATIDAGGHTVAVLAHGLQMIAPSRHRKLAEDILSKGGALVSEYPFGRTVQPQQFVKRDRTQAGMAQGVVMIQSDVKGGSLHASRAALDYGRWLAVPLPTSKDRENREPKIQANLVIAESADSDRRSLLKCSDSDLTRVKVLRSREDYFGMVDGLSSDIPEVRQEAVVPPEEEAQLDFSESAPEQAPTATPEIAEEATSSCREETKDSDLARGDGVELPRIRLVVTKTKGKAKRPQLLVPDPEACLPSGTDENSFLKARLDYIAARLKQLRAPVQSKKPEPDAQEKIHFATEDLAMQMLRVVRILGGGNAIADLDPGSPRDLSQSLLPEFDGCCSSVAVGIPRGISLCALLEGLANSQQTTIPQGSCDASIDIDLLVVCFNRFLLGRLGTPPESEDS